MVHAPAVHWAVAFARLHGKLQNPQFWTDVLMSVSQTVPGFPSHSALPAGQVVTLQVPFVQVQLPGDAVQSLAQEPHAVGSLSVFLSQPSRALPLQSW